MEMDQRCTGIGLSVVFPGHCVAGELAGAMGPLS